MSEPITSAEPADSAKDGQKHDVPQMPILSMNTGEAQSSWWVQNAPAWEAGRS